MSIFILSRINKIEGHEKPYLRDHYNKMKHNDRMEEWEFIRSMTIAIMVLEVCNVIGFVLILLYQPNDYTKEKEFDAIGGVLSE
jgi:hypothetical protein